MAFVMFYSILSQPNLFTDTWGEDKESVLKDFTSLSVKVKIGNRREWDTHCSTEIEHARDSDRSRHHCIPLKLKIHNEVNINVKGSWRQSELTLFLTCF